MTATIARRSVTVALAGAGIASSLSGFLIQVRYHMGGGAAARGTVAVWGWGYAAWASFHQIASAMLLAIAAWHLYVNRKPLLAVFKRAGVRRRRESIFYATFALTAATALCAWAVGVLVDNRHLERALIEIHDKAAIAMFVLLAVHVYRRRRSLLRAAVGAAFGRSHPGPAAAPDR